MNYTASSIIATTPLLVLRGYVTFVVVVVAVTKYLIKDDLLEITV